MSTRTLKCAGYPTGFAVAASLLFGCGSSTMNESERSELVTAVVSKLDPKDFSLVVGVQVTTVYIGQDVDEPQDAGECTPAVERFEVSVPAGFDAVRESTLECAVPLNSSYSGRSNGKDCAINFSRWTDRERFRGIIVLVDCISPGG
jgi:hypothetical protein